MSQELSFFGRVALHVPTNTIVLIFLFGVLGVHISGGFGTARAERLTDTTADSTDSQAPADDDFDLGLCQRRCQGILGGQVGGGTPVGQIPSCIQDCNDKSWKEFDRRMKKLK